MLALVPSGDSARSLIRAVVELVTSKDDDEGLTSSRCAVSGAREVRVDEMGDDGDGDGGGSE